MSRKDEQIPFIRQVATILMMIKQKPDLMILQHRKVSQNISDGRPIMIFLQTRVISLILVKQNVSSPVKAL